MKAAKSLGSEEERGGNWKNSGLKVKDRKKKRKGTENSDRLNLNLKLFISGAADAVIDSQSQALFGNGGHGNVFISGQTVGKAQVSKEIGSCFIQIAGRT